MPAPVLLLKKSSILLVWTLIVTCSFSQVAFSSYSDSDLRDSLLNSPTESDKAIYANKLSAYFFAHSFDSVLFYAKMAERYGELSNEKTEIAVAIYRRAVAEKQLGRLSNSYETLLSSIKKFGEINDTTGKIKALNVLGLLQKERGDYQSAINSLKESIRLSQATNDRKRSLIAYNNLVAIYIKQEDYLSGLKAIDSIQGLLHERDDNIWAFNGYMSKGNFVFQFDSVSYARIQYQCAKEVAIRNQDTKQIMIAESSIGKCLLVEDKTDSAIQVLEKAIDLNISESDTISKKVLLEQVQNLAYSYFLIKKYEKAGQLIRSIGHLVNNKASSESQLSLNILQGRCYFASKNIDSAKIYFANSLQLMAENPEISNRSGFYEFIYVFYNSIDHRLAKSVFDSLVNSQLREKNNLISSLKIEHREAVSAIGQRQALELEKKVLELEATKEKAFRNQVFLAGGLLALAIFSVLLYLSLKYRSNQRLAEAKLDAKETRERELLSLRKRISEKLHNVLSALQIQINNQFFLIKRAVSDTERNQHIEKATVLSHNMIQRAELATKDLLSSTLVKEGVAGEFRVLALRFRDEMECEVRINAEDFEDRFDLEQEEFIFEAGRELINNAWKYSEVPQIEVSLYWTAENLQLSVKDYGNGFDFENVKHNQGLDIVHQYVRNLKGQIHYEYDNGSRITLMFPKSELTLLK